MKKRLVRVFLDEKIILSVIVINAIIIITTESGVRHPCIFILDIACTLYFVIEMLLKISIFGNKSYWHDGWNAFDGVLVIMSLPSLVIPFFDSTFFNFSTILSLRLIRIMRFLRLFHFFPNLSKIWQGLHRALKQSGAVLIGFIIIITFHALFNCSLFGKLVPEYFGTPLKSLYTIFRIVTIEGWYEIPDAIAQVTSHTMGIISKIYFAVFLMTIGILGVSFINSVFVDAMVEDNNDDVKIKLDEIEKKLDSIINSIPCQDKKPHFIP